MDLEDIDKQAKKADGLLTTLGVIWDKHWKKLLVLAVLTPIIWFCSLVVEEVENPTEEVVPGDEYYIGEEPDTIYMLKDTIE
jgi:hypothetical protein